MPWTPSITVVLGLALVVATGCAPGGDQAAPSPGGESVERTPDEVAALACGDGVDVLPGRVDGLTLTGEFAARVDRGGDGAFAGTVKLTSTGAAVSGTTSPEADVYVASGGKVVATPPAKDSVGASIDLRPGTGREFSARGSVRGCAAAEPLDAGRYDVFAVVVVNRDDGPAVVVAGGPWPIEVV
ncbi:hypothetical protein ABZ816_33660 [Actinosynnema sp. NPDC047251]|uniref:Putative secreted protein n=1 Tax=Saccharothrix espanaensis (strain ATCC 51144 / DSM 44229 / JCM 9112 / NBRC 15066 / NRRL 15764) TaxID=1179773 RepID=K0K8A8_SACES|nr:hypothetical protein [Saccharothrix espanaensis]CCH33064.1 putative secreted protein [Saccharothrix espanaensis DSM 44229]